MALLEASRFEETAEPRAAAGADFRFSGKTLDLEWQFWKGYDPGRIHLEAVSLHSPRTATALRRHPS